MDDLKLRIFTSLERELIKYEFKHVRTKDWFVRKRSYGKDYYLLAVIDDIEEGNGYLVSPAAAVRIEQIESIFNQTSAVPPVYHKDSFTLGVDFWREHGAKDFRFHVDGIIDVKSVTDRILSIFRDYAMPFYDEYCTIEHVDRLLNTDPNQRIPIEPLTWYRCSKGLIASKLVGRGNHKELQRIYGNQMAVDSNGFYLPSFEALLGTLDALD